MRDMDTAMRAILCAHAAEHKRNLLLAVARCIQDPPRFDRDNEVHMEAESDWAWRARGEARRAIMCAHATAHRRGGGLQTHLKCSLLPWFDRNNEAHLDAEWKWVEEWVEWPEL
jgi:hypothetical protein